VNNLEKNDIKSLFKDYKREKLKDKLNIMKNTENNMNSKDMQKDFLEADKLPLDPM